MDIEGFVRRRVSVALLALVVVVPAACSGGGGEAEQKADSRDRQEDEEPGGAPGQDAEDDAEEPGGDGTESGDRGDPGDPAAAARAAYVAYQTMFERLAIAPEPDDPEIEQRTSGAELDRVVDTLADWESRNLAVEFGHRHRHNVYEVTVDASGAGATVLDCFVSDARLVNADTRRILRGDPEGGTATVVTATIVRGADGEWKVDATGSEGLEDNETCGAEGLVQGGT